jgi:hypothetical protein
MKLFRLYFVAAVAIVFLVSCATVPKRTSVDESWQNEFAGLAEGGSAYVYVDVSEMRSVLDNINLGNRNGSDAKEIFDVTSSGVIGMYPEGSERSFMISSNGNFPVFQSSIAMTFSSAWQKIKSETGIPYWHSEAQNLSLAISSQKAFVSDGKLFEKSFVSAEVPESFSKIRQRFVAEHVGFEIAQKSVMAGWIDKAGEKINPFLAASGLPIQIPAERILFAFFKVPNSLPENPLYDGMMYIEVPTVSQAKAIITILGFASISAGGIDDSQTMGKILKSILSQSPSLDGTMIKLNAGILSAEEMSLLFNMFSDR